MRRLSYANSATLLRLTQTLLATLCLALSLSCSNLWGGNSNSKSNSRNSQHTVQPAHTAMNSNFVSNLPQGLRVPDESDAVGKRLLAEYGAMFVARGGAQAPPEIIFADDAEVTRWQSSVRTARADMGGISVELQAPALDALLKARDEAQSAGLKISPRGADAARRSYTETVALWLSRVEPGLQHWTNAGQLSQSDADRIKRMSPRDQVSEILKLEERGLYFSRDFSKSILSSVAAPGASQHISMLAFDVNEHDNPAVRQILARHGWFQTVTSDTPHFTYLGVTEDQLPSLGLKRVTSGGRTFWVPDVE